MPIIHFGPFFYTNLWIRDMSIIHFWAFLLHRSMEQGHVHNTFLGLSFTQIYGLGTCLKYILGLSFTQIYGTGTCRKYIFGPFSYTDLWNRDMPKINFWAFLLHRSMEQGHAHNTFLGLSFTQIYGTGICLKYIFGPFFYTDLWNRDMPKIHFWAFLLHRSMEQGHAENTFLGLSLTQIYGTGTCRKYIFGPFSYTDLWNRDMPIIHFWAFLLHRSMEQGYV